MSALDSRIRAGVDAIEGMEQLGWCLAGMDDLLSSAGDLSSQRMENVASLMGLLVRMHQAKLKELEDARALLLELGAYVDKLEAVAEVARVAGGVGDEPG